MLSTINHQPSTINHQPSTINHQPSTINHQPSTINHVFSMLNWMRYRSGWSDIQNAKFISSVDGEGMFLTVGNHKRHIDCTEKDLALNVSRLQNGSYEYPLQRWIGSNYVLFNQLVVEIPSLQQLICSVELFASKGRPSPSSGVLEVSVVTVYLRVSFAPSPRIPKLLERLLTESGMWELFYDTALEFITTNRHNELKQFTRIYSSKLPRDCFINLYDVGVRCGVKPHRDHVSFCTVVLCLVGSGEGNLVIKQETGENLSVSLRSKDLLVFARIVHSVEILTRTNKRITINAFF
jgi:hypothetical protein